MYISCWYVIHAHTDKHTQLRFIQCYRPDWWCADRVSAPCVRTKVRRDAEGMWALGGAGTSRKTLSESQQQSWREAGLTLACLSRLWLGEQKQKDTHHECKLPTAGLDFQDLSLCTIHNCVCPGDLKCSHVRHFKKDFFPPCSGPENQLSLSCRPPFGMTLPFRNSDMKRYFGSCEVLKC